MNERTSWTVGGVDEAGYEDVADLLTEAMLIPDEPEGLMETLGPWREAQGYERILVVRDEGRVAGTTETLSLRMALPGGTRPVAGVSAVGVSPTHRRRGVLSALMRRQLSDMREAGERVAALYASEGTIYGRFGFGAASVEHGVTLRRPFLRLTEGVLPDPSLRVVLGTAGGVREDLARVHRDSLAYQVGRFERDTAWWDRLLADRPERRGGLGPLRAAVVYDTDTPSGYALYRSGREWRDGGLEGSLRVWEAVATTPAARATLYHHLLSRDLLAEIHFEHLAVDDPLWSLSADPQRLLVSPYIALWARLVDVPGALSERSYAAPFEGVLEVADRYAPWNAGRWRLRADVDGAVCEPTDAAPDLSLDVSSLGAVYFGHFTVNAKVAAGVVVERTPGAAARLDTALRTTHAPLCGVIF